MRGPHGTLLDDTVARVTRIVAGVAGGASLRVPAKGTRPTSERVREALFNALDAAGEVTGARVLDLYAGSGALGLEALSRGAETVLFVESDRAAVRVLNQNVRTVGLPGALVRTGTVRGVLASAAPHPFDLVLADPPYRLAGTELDAMLAALLAGDWLAEHGVLVAERAATDEAPEWPVPLRATRSRRYGDTVLHFATRG